jgi:hypothetical protein
LEEREISKKLRRNAPINGFDDMTGYTVGDTVS